MTWKPRRRDGAVPFRKRHEAPQRSTLRASDCDFAKVWRNPPVNRLSRSAVVGAGLRRVLGRNCILLKNRILCLPIHFKREIKAVGTTIAICGVNLDIDV